MFVRVRVFVLESPQLACPSCFTSTLFISLFFFSSVVLWRLCSRACPPSFLLRATLLDSLPSPFSFASHYYLSSLLLGFSFFFFAHFALLYSRPWAPLRKGPFKEEEEGENKKSDSNDFFFLSTLPFLFFSHLFFLLSAAVGWMSTSLACSFFFPAMSPAHTHTRVNDPLLLLIIVISVTGVMLRRQRTR